VFDEEVKRTEEKYKQFESECRVLRNEKDSQRQNYLSQAKTLQDKLELAQQQNE
jgi:hypothetical protein